MTLLPETLRGIGGQLPLPDASTLENLFLHDLLVPWLQRSLLEALAEQTQHNQVEAVDSQQLQRLADSLILENGTQGLEAWCTGHGIKLSNLQRLASFPIRLQIATEQIWGDEVSTRFLERRSSLDQVTLSILRFEDADLAQELYFQLSEAETSFAQLIEDYASQPGQPARGLVGPVALDQLHPLLARAAERYEPGALIPPLEINGQVHLIRVESLNKASLDEPMRQRLLVELRQQWLSEQLASVMKRLSTDPSTPSVSSIEQ